MNYSQLYFILSTAILALLLFFPVSKLIWTLSVRRLQKKLGRELDHAEMAGQRRRARFIAAILVIIFAFLFNNSLVGNIDE